MAWRLAMPVSGSTVASLHVSATRSASEPKAARRRGSRMRAASTAMSEPRPGRGPGVERPRAAGSGGARRRREAGRAGERADEGDERAEHSARRARGCRPVAAVRPRWPHLCRPPRPGRGGAYGAKVPAGTVPRTAVPARTTRAQAVMARKYLGGPPGRGSDPGQDPGDNRARASSRPSRPPGAMPAAPPAVPLRPGLPDQRDAGRRGHQVLQADPARGRAARPPGAAGGERLLEVVEVGGVVDVTLGSRSWGRTRDAGRTAASGRRRQRHADGLERAGRASKTAGNSGGHAPGNRATSSMTQSVWPQNAGRRPRTGPRSGVAPRPCGTR